jgi:hypothetical protein
MVYGTHGRHGTASAACGEWWGWLSEPASRIGHSFGSSPRGEPAPHPPTRNSVKALSRRRVVLGCRFRLPARHSRLSQSGLHRGSTSIGHRLSQEGTDQGGVVSPILNNIYLHDLLDKRFVEMVQARCWGHTFMVRFADDFIMGFELLKDAQEVMRVIDNRFARFGPEG